jgi:hypothetical protein
MKLRDVISVIAADRAKLALALVAILALLVGTVTFGSWAVGSDAGNGYAKATTSQNLTLSDVSASTVGDLYPGGSGNVLVRIHNPNSFAVTITAISGDGSITSDIVACDATTVTYTNQTSLSLALAAGATTTFTRSNAASMSSPGDNDCQGSIFTIPVTVTATS